MGNDFLPWDVEKEYSPETYIEKGNIHLSDNVAFKTSKDVANVFGHNYKGYQRGGTTHPYYDDWIVNTKSNNFFKGCISVSYWA